MASIGVLISRTLPFTSSDTIKVFRHAISLDERRTRFNTVLWQPKEEALCQNSTTTQSNVEGVIEMWFVGVHSGTFDLTPLHVRKYEFQLTFRLRLSISDVGGGEVRDEEPHSLANISFRWMLQEIHQSECGILFDYHALRDLGIPADSVPPSSARQDPAALGLQSIATSAPAPDSKSPASTPNAQFLLPQKSESSTSARFVSFLRTLKLKAKNSTPNVDVQSKETLAEQASKSCTELDMIDALEPIHDQLVEDPLWWLLQFPIWYPGNLWCVSLSRTT